MAKNSRAGSEWPLYLAPRLMAGRGLICPRTPQGTSDPAKQPVGWECGEERKLTKDRITARNSDPQREAAGLSG